MASKKPKFERTETVPIAVRLPLETVDALNRLAKKKGWPRSWFIRQLLEEAAKAA